MAICVNGRNSKVGVFGPLKAAPQHLGSVATFGTRRWSRPTVFAVVPAGGIGVRPGGSEAQCSRFLRWTFLQALIIFGCRTIVLPLCAENLAVALLTLEQRSVEVARSPFSPPWKANTAHSTGTSGTDSKVVRMPPLTESMRPTRFGGVRPRRRATRSGRGWSEERRISPFDGLVEQWRDRLGVTVDRGGGAVLARTAPGCRRCLYGRSRGTRTWGGRRGGAMLASGAAQGGEEEAGWSPRWVPPRAEEELRLEGQGGAVGGLEALEQVGGGVIGGGEEVATGAGEVGVDLLLGAAGRVEDKFGTIEVDAEVADADRDALVDLGEGIGSRWRPARSGSTARAVRTTITPRS